MKHLLFANKTILVGDDAADALVEYGVALAAHSTADRVEYTGIGDDGGTVQAVFLLNAGAALVTVTTPSDLPEPDNTTEITRIRERTSTLTGDFPVQPSDQNVTFDLEYGLGFWQPLAQQHVSSSSGCSE